MRNPLTPFPDPALFEFIAYGEDDKVLGRGETTVRNLRMDSAGDTLTFHCDLDDEIVITMKEEVVLKRVTFGRKGDPPWFEEYPNKWLGKGESWWYMKSKSDA